jgi:hypothetical protein
MIKFQSRGGREHLIFPVFTCDVCGQAIADVGSGAVVFRGFGVGGGELLELMHVHKGRCHDQAEARMCGSRGPWHELADHVKEIQAGLGITIRDMINREVGWSCALTPSEHFELQRRITRLFRWLRARGVSSPLWDGAVRNPSR